MDKNYLVTQSNKLISAHYDLSLEEQRIILTLASMIQPEDEEFKSYEFKIKEFIKLLGVSTKTKYTDIPKITENLMKKIIKIREDKKLIQVSWLSSAVYNERTGTVILRFDPNLKPYLLKLNELFTSFKLANVLNLKSKYAIRIYEILKSYEYRKNKYTVIEISELRLMLGISDTEYNRYDNFKRKVILQAQKEINKKTDLSFDFEEIKTGKKVTSLKFIISKNPLVASNRKDECDDVLEEICATSENMLENYNVINDDYIDKVMFLFDEEITRKEAEQILKVANNDINKVKEKYIIAKQTNGIKNIVGWIIKAIQDDYKTKKRAIPGWDNTYKRDYDIDDLEQKLLEISKKASLKTEK